jgi:ATPase subunit of ABC transporter with duplicated ATPase domains
MGHLEASHLEYRLPDGRVLLDDVSFRVGEGTVAALAGANGAGKTTLLRLLSGELRPRGGTVTSSGGVGVMRQFVGSVRDASTVRDLLVSVAPPRIRQAARAVDEAEHLVMTVDDEAVRMTCAQALADWAKARGYEAETLRDMCTMAALGVPYVKAQGREVRTLSGGERKRLALEALLRGPDEVLLLDEPDNYLDVPGKRWLEDRLAQTGKTVLFVSHDRELLARAAERVVAVEPGPAGSEVWVHPGGFGTFHEAQQERFARFEELRRRWDEKHAQLKRLVQDLQQYAARSDDMASRHQAARTRLRKFEEIGPPPEPPRKQDIRMRLQGGRTGVRAVTCEQLELTGLMKPFSLEIFYGERVAVAGSNGSGTSHFLRLLAGEDIAHTGKVKLGARVVPGHFAQTHAHPELMGRTLVDILWTEHPGPRRGHVRAAPLRTAPPGGPDLRPALRRPAGPLPDPAAGTGGHHRAVAGRADGQPGPGVGGSPPGGPAVLREDGAGGHPRPLVRAVLRPFPGVRQRRPGTRDAGAGVGRTPGGACPLTGQQAHDGTQRNLPQACGPSGPRTRGARRTSRAAARTDTPAAVTVP